MAQLAARRATARRNRLLSTLASTCDEHRVSQDAESPLCSACTCPSLSCVVDHPQWALLTAQRSSEYSRYIIAPQSLYLSCRSRHFGLASRSPAGRALILLGAGMGLVAFPPLWPARQTRPSPPLLSPHFLTLAPSFQTREPQTSIGVMAWRPSPLSHVLPFPNCTRTEAARF